MRHPVRTVALCASALLIATFLVFLVNQTVQVVGLAERIHPAAGTAVLWGLLVLYAGCAVVPLVMLFRLPRPLRPPASDAAPDFEAHLEALGLRLKGNPLLREHALSSRGDIEVAIRTLDARADEIIRSTGSQVFLTTAVSQNGSLDGLIVLLAQSKMLWQIAHVYYQRPSVRDLALLYGNVASTALIASQIEDVDLAEHVQPLLSGALGSAAGAIPGLHAASTLLVSAIMSGTANAFLTLRVGIVAKTYCGALVLPERRTLRRAAVAQAAQMLGAIARDGAKRVAGAFWTASKSRASDTARGFAESVRRSVRTFVPRRSPMTSDPTGHPRDVREAGPNPAG
jgi:hypothetical protein